MRIEVTRTEIPDLMLIDHEVYRDERGFFMEVYRNDIFRNVGLNFHFVQFNHSASGACTCNGNRRWER
jgi:dTDP-4-dehydrorhamnose 3,5-epimerase